MVGQVCEEDLVVGVHTLAQLLLPRALGKSSDHFSRTKIYTLVIPTFCWDTIC
ncbi:hypothetical protein AMTR_s00144p00090130 [Amborella trichopoda]|uniref:Uncharacterized protein n=1 Tax=Amborella trichopoda TaxID=13333 RepID=W1P9P0_AMBTC|nr:hypothetical protein AMTR_s00144p00090130 [Amborella trichopoda]